ncbi:MAG: undecaprenyl/decaprenyl-phosphate alpha-N-acetylglucosaminyl 1-phosphate transferase [Planctomycetaceae bacterium]|jgi:UDP-GlcNAc:undecaprenyl-phosphate GlcNAc-1-phosphate transferase|nr:undecaprenyl/decaprenyl-phosphate alpha-N-acetylglucosaminyl 1-phosphate transferase [Planctomycetaceae bacterium]
MVFIYVLIFLFVMLFSFFCCGVVKRRAAVFGLLDVPGERKIHDEPIPTSGGLGIFAGVIAFFAICQLLTLAAMYLPAFQSVLPEVIANRTDGLAQRAAQLWILLGLGALVLVIGVLDDKYNLHWVIRIAAQTLAAIVAVSQGWRLTIFIDIPLLTAVLSVIWIVGLTNSFNMLDNMNGLSGGVAFICGSFLAAVMFISPNPQSLEPQFFIGGFLVVLVAAVAGFLWHNNPFRATLFLGNGGSYFIGFMLAALTMIATFTSSSNQSPQTIFVPLIILAIPLYDTISVVIIRIKNKKSPFVGDKNHFSHRLVELGLSRTQSVLTIYLATVVSCIGAVLLYQVNLTGAILIFAQTVLVVLLIAILEIASKYKESK